MRTRLSPRPLLLAGLLVAGGCAAPGDYFDKWFGSGPAQKPADLVTFKPSATAKILWQGSVGPAERYVFTPAVDKDSVYAAATAGQIDVSMPRPARCWRVSTPSIVCRAASARMGS